MCSMSVVMQEWGKHIPHVPSTTTPRVVPQYDNDALKELIESLRLAMKAAEKLDRITGQPDCVDPEKATLLDRVEELERRLQVPGCSSSK